MAKVLCLLLVASASAIQIGLPAATSYIYRNDHNAPASLIELGGHSYEQPQAFAAPYPIAQPLKIETIETFDVPAPLPYVAAKPIVVQDAEDDDDSDEGSDEYDDDGDDSGYGDHGGDSDEGGYGDAGYGDKGALGGLGGLGGAGGYGHGAGFEKGEGSSYGAGHHSAHGEKGSKGHASKGHFAKGQSGHYGKGHSEGYYTEADGKKKGHHEEADAHGKHYSKGGSYKGGDHGHKQHASKGEEITGYHKVFNKNEFKKDHDFYDVADKGGHFKKHGYETKHHGAEEGAHKKGGKHIAGFDKGGFGKEGFHAKGHTDDAEDGHSAEEGLESHYNKEGDYGKKGGKGFKKEYGFADEGGDHK